MTSNIFSLDCLKIDNFIVLDLETTGLIPYKSWIIEIAALKCFNWVIVDKFQTLVNPEMHIPSWICKLTWISNNMVENSPIISEIMPSFSRFLEDYVIVWHNISFDFRFLTHYHYICNWTHLNNETVCTLKLARKLLPQLPSKKLWAICDFFWIKNECAHRAMWDTVATLEIFQKFKNLIEN